MTPTFQHRHVKGDGVRRPLLLLHGTGGDENDLLPLGQALAPGAALLSPRGQVLEHGMPRFFARFAEGVFDLDEVRRRADDLALFLQQAEQAYGLAKPIAVGFSNGANIAAAVMIRIPDAIAGAVLLRPMAVLDDPARDIDGRPVLLLSGARDPIVSAESAQRLARQLRDGGATLDHRTLAAGHALTPEDVAIAKTWLADLG